MFLLLGKDLTIRKECGIIGLWYPATQLSIECNRWASAVLGRGSKDSG